MNPIVTLTLSPPNGDPFVFTGAEVPENISIGGQQLLNNQKKLGGRRTVDSMGPDDAPLQWSGLFLYQSAVSRARYIDSLRRTGVVCTLAWDEFRYKVKISEFVADYIKKFRIPYRIECTVVEDETAILDSLPVTTPAQALANDVTQASSLTFCVGDSTLSSLFTSLQSSLASVTNFAQPIAKGLVDISALGKVPQCAGEIVTTAKNTVSAVYGPLKSFKDQVNSLIAVSENSVAAVKNVGGVSTGSPVAKMISDANAQANAATHLPILYELRSTAQRIESNLQNISSPSSKKQVVVGGGDLYKLAMQQYGDAGRWSDIADANGLTDPNLNGINTLIIPA